MNDNFADFIIISVIWIAGAAVSIFLKDLSALVISLFGTVMYVAFSR